MTNSWGPITKGLLKGMDKQSRELLLEAAKTDGVEGRWTRNGHFQVKHAGVVSVMAGTASDTRAFKNDRARLKRMGLVR